MLLVDHACCVLLPVHCSLVVTCLERANILALLCVMFPKWCWGSGVVLDCIDF